MSYRLIKNSKGDRWMKDGKFVSSGLVPEEVKQQLTDLDTIDKKCIVCEESANHKRKVMTMIVALCDEHYFNTSYGAIVGLINKKGLVNVH